MDTVFPDTSEHQGIPANKTMPAKWFAFRSNDGAYVDKLFRANWEYAVHSRLVGFIVYCVWPPSVMNTGWLTTAETLINNIGRKHHRRLVLMIDVESWGGKVKGDHSDGLHQMREYLIKYLFSVRPRWHRSRLFAGYFRSRDRKRVILYGNAGDLRAIAPNRGDAWIVLADYGANSPFPNKIIHQFTNHGRMAPWPNGVDLNSADGYSPRQLARALGLGTLRWTL